MGFINVRKIPTPEEIIDMVPLPHALKEIKASRDAVIKEAFEGKNSLFLVIIGPCSADDEDAVCDYVSRLAVIQEKVKDKLLIIPRIYTNKPRTTGEGYKGMLHQPDPEKAPNMLDGILTIRRMHVRAISESGLTSADEMLYPDNLKYVDDILSYIAIGARSVENQQHRLTASGIDVPVGMKNPTSGDFNVMFNSIIAAQAKHTFLYQGYEVETTGNPHTHAVLRGSVNKHGENLPNYHYEDLTRAAHMYTKRNLLNPTIVIDTNHSNSKKLFGEQPRIVKEVLNSRKYNPTLSQMVKGFMIESYIEEGSRGVGDRVYGKSITDPCLGFSDTEKLLYYMAENV